MCQASFWALEHSNEQSRQKPLPRGADILWNILLLDRLGSFQVSITGNPKTNIFGSPFVHISDYLQEKF